MQILEISSAMMSREAGKNRAYSDKLLFSFRVYRYKLVYSLGTVWNIFFFRQEVILIFSPSEDQPGCRAILS
jgi:hypothetical protein